MTDEGPVKRYDRDTTVFFSYSRADRAVALPIIHLLEAAGFVVWWDGMLEAGVQYLETTEEALETALAVVVLWSKTSVASNWVRDEAMSGRERACLVPIAIDGVQPPLGFRQFQLIDFAGWAGNADAPVAQNLVRATAALHGRDMPRVAARPPGPMPILTRRRMLYSALGASVVLGGGLAVSRLFLGSGGRAPGNSIAVLPFNNDSSDPRQDYLSVGLASELRSILARNPALRVVARSTSEVMKKRGYDAVEVARELGVAFVVEGAVRVIGDTVRVSSDLIEGTTGIGRWSQTYSESLADLLDLQQTLASTISSELSQEVSASQSKARLGAATNPAAFDEYLKGWDVYSTSNSTRTDLEVLGHFDKAISLDPLYASAQAGRAVALTALGNTSDDAAGTQSYYKQALAAARKAVALGPDLDEAHSVLALALFESQLDIKGARASYERSLELGGGSANIQARYAEYAALTGRSEAALRAIDLAIDLDRLNPTIFQSAGLIHYAAGRYEKSIEANRHALSLDGSISSAYAWIGMAQLQLDRSAQAIQACRKEPFTLMGDPCLAIAYRRQNEADAAQAAMNDLIAGYGDAGLYQRAQVRAQWREPDAAMALLVKARASGDAGLTYLKIDPMMNPLRARADFNRLQADLGFT